MGGTSRQGTGIGGGFGLLLAALAAAAALGISPSVIAADVYASTLPDGTVRYASQRLDASYALLFTDTVPSPSAGRAVRYAADAQQLRPLIHELAAFHGIAVELVEAVVAIESRFNARAVSPKGARGPMQLMPATGRRYGLVEPRQFHVPQQNIDAGIRHLKDLLARHDGNLVLALAAYNAGSGAVRKHGDRIPPYPETMLYVPAVLGRAAAAKP